MNLLRRRSQTRESKALTSPPIAEDAYWQQLTQWGEPEIDATAFANLLGVSVAAIRQYRTRGDGFPEPIAAGWRNVWSPAQAYDFIASRRPKRRGLIPRIYHHGHGLAPGAWIAAERHTILSDQGDPTTWIVHVWQPADDRGTVAMAYRDTDVGHTDALTWAVRILDALGSVTAVAVVTEEWKVLRDPAPQRFQPEVVVADRRQTSNGDTRTVVETFGWFDLANLLRVNLPWWPIGLRRLDDIQAWRPGAAPQAVRPYAPFFDEDALDQLLAEAADPGEAERCRGVVDAINARFEAALYDAPAHPDVPGETERPGLFQAAYPRYRTPTPPEPPTLGELFTLMNLRVPSEAARQNAVALLAGRSEVRAMVGTTIRTTEADETLAREWISRLKPCEDPQTLGASFARRTFTAAQRQQPHQWWYDPRSDFGWIAQTTDGEYHATVGTCMPARDTLTEFEVEQGWNAAFFRAAGTVWPMPLGGSGYYTCGYRGTGPDNLIAAVTHLYAAADTVLPDTSDTSDAPAALKELIRTREAPLFVSEAELDAISAKVSAV